MEWIEVSIDTTSEAVEAVSAMLMEAGVSGIQIEDDAEFRSFLEAREWDYVDEELLNLPLENRAKITMYLSSNDYGRETLLSVKSGLERLKSIELGVNAGTLALSAKGVDDEEWINKWKEYYKPFQVGKKIIIRPEWETYENPGDKVVFSINPGHIFGTGLHQTTQLCIAQLEERVSSGMKIIDIGCGSGILSIIALLLGAGYGFAVDIDPNAVKVVTENALLNSINMENYKVTYGNILEDEALLEEASAARYDIAVANIVADVIVELSAIIPSIVKEGGLFICSGIIKERLEDVYTALKENNLDVVDTLYKDDWVCVVSKLKAGCASALLSYATLGEKE